MAPDLKLVIFAAFPAVGAVPLALDFEVKQIERMLEGSGIQCIPYASAEVKDVTGALSEHRPQMVHFCGHADGDRGVLLQGEAGEGQYFSEDGLVGLLAQFTEHLRVAMLNTCESSTASRRLSRHLNTAIGMGGNVDDESAIFFASILYQALGHGRSIASAFEIARHALLGIDKEMGRRPKMFRSADATRWPPKPSPKQSPSKGRSRIGGGDSGVFVQGGSLYAENMAVGSGSSAIQIQVRGDSKLEAKILDEVRRALRRDS